MSSSKLEDHGHQGVADMDREHAVEMQIVRSLQQALADGERETAGKLMRQLEDFTNAHFLAEQLLMRLHAYPAYEEHQQEHDRLIAELGELRRRIEESESSDPVATAEELERWLVTHIHSDDEALANFLKEARGTIPAAQ